VAKFVFSHSKLKINPFCENFKIQGGQGSLLPTTMDLDLAMVV